MADHSPAMARVGKYLMLDVLGEGAFGKVRLAVDETTGCEYAIKIMEKSHIKANELTLQVRREIAVMKAMRHPNIVNLHEVLASSNNLYMVMDLVTGGELFQAVAEEGRIPENVTRSYFQQLVDAVHYCHSRRVYHRDLKPENLLLSADKQTLKITDFGLSSIKAQNASSELLHTIMGSPHYIAPEIITSAANGYEGSKVDVWAAGVILFGMLAGYLPFDQPNTRALYKAIVQDSVKYPPHFSYDAIKLLKALLQKDPQKRPTMEHVKTFAWFKVNYHPAATPQDKDKSPEKSERRKLRHKLRKHGERSSKKKKDKDDDHHSRLDALKHGRRKRETPDPQLTEQPKLTQRSSVVMEVCAENLADETPWVGGITAATSQLDRHTKENVDPAKQLDDTTPSHDAKSDEPTRSFSDRSDGGRSSKTSDAARMFQRPSNHAKPFGRSSDSHSRSGHSKSGHSKSGEDSGRIIDPARSFTKLSNVARSFTKSRFRHSSSSSQQLSKDLSQSSFGKKESSATTDKGDSAAFRTVSFSSQASAAQTDASHDGDAPVLTSIRSGAKSRDSQSATESEKGDMQQALSRQPSRGSQRSLHGVAESPGKEAQANDAVTRVASLSLNDGKGRERSSGEGDSSVSLAASKAQSAASDVEPVSLTAFISPVSETSRASFTSIPQKQKAPGNSAREQCSLSTNFDSPISRTEIQTPRAVVPNIDDDSGVPSVRGFDDGMTPVSSLANSSIFKPMSGLLESLAQRSPQRNTESMSPSVFCPEVEGDVEGTSEWCIDSVEVFADVEPPENDVAIEEVVEPENKVQQEPAAADAISPDCLKKTESSNQSITDAAKPIFGKLSEELQIQLSSSMKAESVAMEAAKEQPPAQEKALNLVVD